MNARPQPDLSALERPRAAEVPPPRRSWATRVAVPAAVLLAFVGLLAWAGRDALTPALEVRTAPVVARSGSGGGAAAVARAAGWIEPEPFAVHAAALTDGVLADVLVLEGDRVEKGQVVARLVADDARIALDAAKAAAAAARARLARARADKEWADRVAANPIALVRDAATAGAALVEARAGRESAEAEAQAASKLAEAEASRLRKLEVEAANGLAAQDDLAEARSRSAAAALAARAAERRRDASAARVEAMDAANRAAADERALAADTKRAADLAAAALAEAEAEAAALDAAAAAAELRVARLEVRAPAAGVVLELLAAPGMHLTATGGGSTEVLTLYDPARLQVRVDVPLADAAKVGAGQKARVTVEALPGRAFDGEVTRIVPRADVAKNTVQAKVKLAEPDPALRPEMLARVEFAAMAGGADRAPASRSVFAPARLVRVRGADAGEAWVVAGGRAERRDLRLGTGRVAEPSGEWIEVLDGLREGDDLIDADPAALEPGRKVRVVGEAR